jgi:hypothetical protein
MEYGVWSTTYAIKHGVIIIILILISPVSSRPRPDQIEEDDSRPQLTYSRKVKRSPDARRQKPEARSQKSN